MNPIPKPIRLVQEVEKSSDYQVSNGLGLVVATFGSPDLAFSYVGEKQGLLGPLSVEHVRVCEYRQRVARRPRLRAIG